MGRGCKHRLIDEVLGVRSCGSVYVCVCEADLRNLDVFWVENK